MIPSEELLPATVFAEAAGEGVTVALVDSGINFDHPHLRIRGDGLAVQWVGSTIEVQPGGHRDRFGHGTCCAAVIHGLAPSATLLAVRVTHERATTDADRLAFGIRAAAERGAHVICVPLATRSLRTGLLDQVVSEVSESAVVVAASPGQRARPADHEDALGVGIAEGVDVGIGPGATAAGASTGASLVADGYPRRAPGHPTNFFGPSLSTARAAAALARYQQLDGSRGRELRRGFVSDLSLL